MRIESVTAHAFGPLVEGTLKFAPGMTIIVGDNESAKTSWHAAIYSALCGRARRRGRASIDEQWFIDRHKPWDHPSWEVSGILQLDDGRRIEMRHDLAGNVDCSATDLQLARPVSDEIMEDGAPDAAIWLGLDRRSFVATACIHQAQLLAVLNEAVGMQTILQRATATAGKDATAAEALSRLDLFQRSQVGRDDARSTRPLRSAAVALQRATSELQTARAEHAEYLHSVEQVEVLRAAAALTRQELALHEAAAAKKMADDYHARSEQVNTLREKLGDTPPPPETQADALGAQVARALQAWANRSEPAALSGPSSVELREQLATLPDVPAGDLVVAPAVRTAHDAHVQAYQALSAHDQVRPATPETDLPSVGQEELVALAHTLEIGAARLPDTDSPQLEELNTEIERLEAKADRSRLLMVIGVLVVVTGAALAAIGPRVLGVVALIGIGLLGAGVATRKGGALKETRDRYSTVSIRVAGAKESAARVAQDWQRAAERCAELRLPAVPSQLRSVATEMSRHETFAERNRQWSEQRLRLVAEVDGAAARLSEALNAQDATVDEEPEGAYAIYATACEVRSGVARLAARRPDLEEQLSQRLRAEEMADDRVRSATAAGVQVQEAVRACGLTAATPEEGFRELEHWEGRRTTELQSIDERRAEWTQLEALLGGRTFIELTETYSALANDAEARASGFDRVRIAILAEGDPAAHLGALRQRDNNAADGYRYAEGSLAEREKDLSNVAEAEEAEEAAIERLNWLKDLDGILTRTQQILDAAQERVQRDLAPVLAATLNEWLPGITGGRYTEAIIDIETLEVRVCGPQRRWRNAQRLSQGTAEQVYLLLRAALARHLTSGKESCPLLLDDVTVQSDEARTTATLELLHRLSAEQQIIVFAQERTVAEWAKTHLTGPRDDVVQLAVVSEP